MPGPKPKASWKPEDIIKWYELEVEWWKLEGKKMKIIPTVFIIFGSIMFGVLVGLSMGSPCK
jgi:hypothetical protein